MSNNNTFICELYKLNKGISTKSIKIGEDNQGRLVKLLLDNLQKKNSKQLDARIKSYIKPQIEQNGTFEVEDVCYVPTNPKDRQLIGSNYDSNGIPLSRPAVGFYSTQKKSETKQDYSKKKRELKMMKMGVGLPLVNSENFENLSLNNSIKGTKLNNYVLLEFGRKQSVKSILKYEFK